MYRYICYILCIYIYIYMAVAMALEAPSSTEHEPKNMSRLDTDGSSDSLARFAPPGALELAGPSVRK